MKKLTALLLVLVLICSLSVTAFAAGEQTGTTTITAEVPEASYTIHIPADMTLEYGNTDIQDIGTVYISDPVQVTGAIYVRINPSGNLINGSNSIPVTYWIGSEGDYGRTFGGSEGAINRVMYYGTNTSNPNTYFTDAIGAEIADWTAEPGTYTATITFEFRIS